MREGKRLHLGAVFPTLDHQSQYDLWSGIAEYAGKNDIHLTAYFGTYQTTNCEFAVHYETCFDAIGNGGSLDGVIIFAGFIAQNIGLDVFEKYIPKILHRLPTVFVSFAMPGVSSVLVDNAGGMHGAVEHLIQRHGKKRIAFVKGPDGHPEAEERLEGYKKALAANGIAFDTRYVLPGDFSLESGRAAAAELMGRRREISADAIVASDDETAIGVLAELKRRNISVPADIAVVGFDDERGSATFVPSISTVRQDFFELGRLSAETLYRKINGEAVEDVTYLTPTFVARESCGCAPSAEMEPGCAKKSDCALARKESQDADASIFHLLVRRITSSLVLLFDIDALAKELCWSLPELSIKTALVGFYREHIKSGDLNADRTIGRLIGFDGDKKFDLKHDDQAPGGQVPMRFYDYSTIGSFDFGRERRTLLFMPLFIKDEELGVALLSFDPQIPVGVYETLRVNISTAAKSVKLMSKIYELSTTDELTGLFNRRGFFQFAYSKLKYLSREAGIVPVILFMDMDGLKCINDTYGHSEGDKAISAFAQILKDILREGDIIGRIGGDEFAVFSSVKSETNTKQLEKRIRAELDEYNGGNHHAYSVACSIGCVVLDVVTKECFDAAMLRADSVLYEEKSEKRKKGLSR